MIEDSENPQIAAVAPLGRKVVTMSVGLLGHVCILYEINYCCLFFSFCERVRGTIQENNINLWLCTIYCSTTVSLTTILGLDSSDSRVKVRVPDMWGVGDDLLPSKGEPRVWVGQ